MEKKIVQLGCFDAVLPDSEQAEAEALAIKENPANGGDAGGLGVQSGPLDFMAVETQKMWMPGRTLRVYFLNGSAFLQAKVKQFALEWTKWANINFEFSTDPTSEIRVNFDESGGS